MRQWRQFGISTQKVFLRVVREEVSKKTEESRHKVRHDKETAYEVSREEMVEYGESLQSDLKRLEGAFASWEGDETEENTDDEGPTRISGWKGKEAGEERPKDIGVDKQPQGGEEEVDREEEEEDAQEEDAEEYAEEDAEEDV